ncbi:MAG: hypothetical protein Q8O59_01120 [bacterium]|nr:hypothetical protein [bacterium]
MAEDAVKAETAPVVARIKRCDLCSGMIGDENHQEDGICGFWARVRMLAAAANSGLTTRA